MAAAELIDLSALYQQDETAWLEAMAELASTGRYSEMDFVHLSTYLRDMAKRDQREVFSRLVALLCHLLKWDYQPDKRSGSWRATIREQRRELRQLLQSASLRRHAEMVLPEAYEEARLQAADETDLPASTFPKSDARGIDDLLDDTVS